MEKNKKKSFEITEKSITFTGEEISKIKSFIEEISEIPCIDCVYVLPLYSFLNKKAGASIIATYSYDEEYAKEPVGNGLYGYDIVFEETEKADEIAFKYDECDRLYFNTKCGKDFVFPPKRMDELMAITDLYYSTILFDKTGDKTRIQEEILSNFTIPDWINKSCSNVITIGNPEELTGETLLLKRK